MCTSISLSSHDDKHLLARTMDFSFELEPEMCIFPRKYPLSFISGKLTEHYALMGLSKNIGSYFVADAVNEYGLSGAALYFEGYAHYNKEADANKKPVAPHELVMWLLCRCRSIEEVLEELLQIDIVDHVLDFLGVVPPLHYTFMDKSGRSIIIEFMSDGTHIHENKLGVLTNSPDYSWHLTHVRSFIGLDPKQVASREIYGELFKPFGQGSGTFGLPGDFTPPSRFIKTLYNKLSAKKATGEKDLVLKALHILNGVDIPLGSVITPRDSIDYTQYTSYMVLNGPTYYYRLANSLDVKSVEMASYNVDGDTLIQL